MKAFEKFENAVFFSRYSKFLLIGNWYLSKGPSIKDIWFFWPILDLLTYLYPIFGPIFGHIYLSISIYILFLQTYWLTGMLDILYGCPVSESVMLTPIPQLIPSKIKVAWKFVKRDWCRLASFIKLPPPGGLLTFSEM